MLSFRTFYEVDDDEVPTALRLEVEEYGGEDDDEYGLWILIEPTADGGEAEGDAMEVPEVAGSV